MNTEFVPTEQIGSKIETFVQNVAQQRKAFERRWYNNNFFDDGYHYRFVSRTTGKVVDLTSNNDSFIPYRAIPKASRQIRGIANLLLSQEPQAVVYPEHILQSTYADPKQYQQAQMEAEKNAKHVGRWIEWSWKKYELKKLLTHMVILAAKNGISYLQIWPDPVKEDIKFRVFDAFDIYVDPSVSDIYDSPFLVKATPQTIEEIKANENFDEEAIAKIRADNKYAPSEIKEAYMMARFGMRRNDDKTATVILKEGFVREYVNQDNIAEIKKDVKDFKGKQGDIIIRQIFEVGGLVLRDTYTEFNEYPFVDFRFEPGYIYQVPMIERFLSANKSLDAVLSRIERYIGTQIVGVYMKRRGENYRINNIAGGAEIEYDIAPPAQMPLSPMPGFVFNYVNILESLIEEQGASTSALGQVPTGVKSGVAIESLKATEYANLKISGDQLKGTVYRIAQRMLDLASRYFITPKTVTMMDDGKPTYFDIIGERGMEAFKKLAQKGALQVPEATVVKKDYNIDIDVQSGMGFTEEGKRTTMMQVLDFLTNMAKNGLISQETVNYALKNFTKTFQFGNTAEFMDTVENGVPAGQAGDDKLIQAVKVGTLEALKEAGEVGQEASDKRIKENKIGLVEALKDMGVTMPSEVPDNPELDAIPYKDAPEDIKRQMEEKAGLVPSKGISPIGAEQSLKVMNAQQSASQADKSHELSVAQFAQSGQQAQQSHELQKEQLKQKGGQREKNKSR
jgi:hypothetical protein